ncbi:MAG: hypothetical protein ACXWWY_12165 [Candidatus Deferrimicrobiaceae bacterium]
MGTSVLDPQNAAEIVSQIHNKGIVEFPGPPAVPEPAARPAGIFIR